MFSVTTGMVVFRKTTAPKNLLGGVEMGARNLISAVLLVSSFIVSGSASAHHNPTAMYEPERVVLTGTVTRYEWANPHSIISVAVKTDKGTVEQWHAEFLPPADMIRDGWTKETIKPSGENLGSITVPVPVFNSRISLEERLTVYNLPDRPRSISLPSGEN